MRTLIILIIVSFVSVGCQVPVTSENAATVDLSKNGVVVASVENVGDAEDAKAVRISYYLRPKGDRFRYSFVESTKKYWVLTMSPGEYSISDWYMVVGQQKQVRSDTKYSFSVKPGTVTYIGRLEAVVGRDKDMFGLKWIPKAEPRVKDQRDEDLAYFRENYKTWSSLPVEFQVVDQFEWEEVETSRGSVPGM